MDRSVGTKRSAARGFALAGLVASAALLAGCSGGSDAAASTAPPPIVVTGTVTFDRVPTSGVRLDYTGVAAAPARGIVVEAVQAGTVLGTGETDAVGRYTLSVPADAGLVQIRALAQMRRTGAPAWEFRVVDNTRGNALYVLESPAVSAGTADLTVDLHAASGWDGAAYSGPRAAAPFAILDVVRAATDFVVAAAPEITLPPLDLHWSPSNVARRGEDGSANFVTGEIGSSHCCPISLEESQLRVFGLSR